MKCSAARAVLAWAMVALVGSDACAATAVAAAVGYRHLGVASCASGVCHGKIESQKLQKAPKVQLRDVALNEYRIWSQNDRHSQAYKTLLSPRSRVIAEKLGLPSANTAKICLDCHADNVPKILQGPKFQLSDGVGCEACHGGAEKWIETHTQTTQTHAANVAAGLYPSEQPLRRAELCISCHLGTVDKFATHVIMGAGHPRLSFEMEAYTANQPAHFTLDDIYVKRKGRISGVNLWVTGQLENAHRYLALLQSGLLTPGGLLPELAFYDCFSCHHPMDQLRWSGTRAGPGIKPGTLRLQKHYFVTLRALTEVIAPELLPQIVDGSDALVRAGQADTASIRAAAKNLDELLRQHDDWSRRAYAASDADKLRKALVRYAADGKGSDFAAAEQIELGVESISQSIGDSMRRKAALDALYSTVKSASVFSPDKFASVAAGLRGQF